MPLDLPKPKPQPTDVRRQPKLTPLLDGQVFRRSATQNSDVNSLYETWNTSRSRQDMGPLLKGLTPAIDQAIYRHTGTSADALLRGQARGLVAKALPKYDPKRASLETFISQQVQPLIRYQSRRKRVVRLPDRVQMEAATIGEVTRSLEQENGRPPSVRQIADATGLSISKINKIRKVDRQVTQSSAEAPGEEPGMLTAGDAAVFNDAAASEAWMKFVRDDLNDVDQAILEHTTGMDGAEILSNQDLARRFNLSPGAISQRKAKIQALLDRETSISPFG